MLAEQARRGVTELTVNELFDLVLEEGVLGRKEVMINQLRVLITEKLLKERHTEERRLAYGLAGNEQLIYELLCGDGGEDGEK